MDLKFYLILINLLYYINDVFCYMSSNLKAFEKLSFYELHSSCLGKGFLNLQNAITKQGIKDCYGNHSYSSYTAKFIEDDSSRLSFQELSSFSLLSVSDNFGRRRGSSFQGDDDFGKDFYDDDDDYGDYNDGRNSFIDDEDFVNFFYENKKRHKSHSKNGGRRRNNYNDRDDDYHQDEHHHQDDRHHHDKNHQNGYNDKNNDHNRNDYNDRHDDSRRDDYHDKEDGRHQNNHHDLDEDRHHQDKHYGQKNDHHHQNEYHGPDSSRRRNNKKGKSDRRSKGHNNHNGARNHRKCRSEGDGNDGLGSKDNGKRFKRNDPNETFYNNNNDEDSSIYREKRSNIRPDLTSISELIRREIALKDKFEKYLCVLRRRGEILRTNEVREYIHKLPVSDYYLEDDREYASRCSEYANCIADAHPESSVFPRAVRQAYEFSKCALRQARLICIKENLRQLLPSSYNGTGSIGPIYEELLEKLMEIVTFNGDLESGLEGPL